MAAVDPFEIQVYDATANSPGVPGIELHVNRVFDGIRSAAPPELPAHHQSHFTLEPSLGVLPFLELGAYLQTALNADGSFDYAGTKLRTKLVTPPGWHDHVRLGVNIELSLLPERYDPGRWGGEIRPIVAWENYRWLFAVNPIIGLPLGSDASEGPSFEPAAMAKVKIEKVAAFGVEYYASLGPIAGFEPISTQAHYLYEVVDLLAVQHFELNAGVGEGLTRGSNGFVAKVILGYSWEPATPESPHPEPLVSSSGGSLRSCDSHDTSSRWSLRTSRR
jgi:hypothetical protein